MSAELGSLGSGPTLCGTVPQCVVQSQVDAVWSSSQWSGPTLCGPVPQGVACRGIVGILLIYARNRLGYRRTGFAVVRSYVVRGPVLQRLVQSWAVYTVGSGLIVGGLPSNRQPYFVISG